MPLKFDHTTGKILYEGKEVGEYENKDGKAIVKLNIVYVCSPDDWVVPLSWFDYGLNLLPQHQAKQARSKPDLTVASEPDSIEKEFDVLRVFNEKTVKRGSFVWDFHKSDADPWPSLLHGHDYDKGLKLDAITSQVYDVVTKTCCKVLKEKDLKAIQDALR